MTVSRPTPRPSAPPAPSAPPSMGDQAPRYVVTANDLLDGGVRYLQLGAGGWTRNIARATAAHGAEARNALLAVARTDVGHNLIVDPYAIEVERTAAGLAHASTRERIRAGGPTTERTGP